MADDRAAIDAYHGGLARDLLETTHLSIWEAVRRVIARQPTRDAVVFGAETLSYGALGARVLRCAARLQRLGVARGGRVALLFHPCPDWLVLHYALARLGAIAVPINLAYEAKEIEYLLDCARPELLIAVSSHRGVDQQRKFEQADAGVRLHDSIFLEVLADGRLARDAAHARVYGRDTDPELAAASRITGGDPAYILFTSGSTAAPKPALCAHRAYTGGATALIHALQLTPEDRMLAASPTFHTSGVLWSGALFQMAGMTVDMIGSWEAGLALEIMERQRHTVLGAFDTKITRMMGLPEFASRNLSSLRVANIGATPSFLEKIEPAWSFEKTVQIYGSTESGGTGSITPWPQRDAQVRRQSNGMPVPGMEFRILDPQSGAPVLAGEPGEICFRGWGCFIEYSGNPEATDAALDAEGFFHSGDYGWLDEAGNLYFRGRYKMMIKTGGENVAEREVEIFLESELPEVRFAQVVGVPDARWGEAVCAFVELEPSARVQSESLRARCKGKIAGFKIPKHFLFVAAGQWPLLDSGRPDKHALRAQARQAVASEVAETVTQTRIQSSQGDEIGG